ncbi:MAG: hypothetical protein QM497_04970 [Sulfurimonas sp.]
MKNWKSTITFFIFISVYVYSIAVNKTSSIIEVTGYIALYSSIFMMFRSDFTKDMLSKLVDNIKIGK